MDVITFYDLKKCKEEKEKFEDFLISCPDCSMYRVGPVCKNILNPLDNCFIDICPKKNDIVDGQIQYGTWIDKFFIGVEVK